MTHDKSLLPIPSCGHEACAGLDKHKGGRPAKIDKFRDLYVATENELHALLEEVALPLRDLILGITIVNVDKDGGERTYYRAPDIQAIKLLFQLTTGLGPIQIEINDKTDSATDGLLDHVSLEDQVSLLELAADAARRMRDETIEGELV